MSAAGSTAFAGEPGIPSPALGERAFAFPTAGIFNLRGLGTRSVRGPVTFTAGAAEQIAPVMEKAKASGATALNVLTAPLFSFNRRIVIEQAAAPGLPAIYEWPEMAEEGASRPIRDAAKLGR